MNKRPNFFLVGTGKAGTTSLHRYLRQHPQIYMSVVKEPSYFAEEVRSEHLSEAFLRHVRRQGQKWPVTDWTEYEALFANANGAKAIGEATPSYLWSETAAAGIHARLPGAKIVMILRDPAERAYSQYLHQLAEGLTRATFREQIEHGMRGGHRKLSAEYPFLEVGLYYEQVKRYLDLFPREHIRIYWYEEAWQQPACLMADLFGFLEVDEGFRVDVSRRALERRAPRLASAWYFVKRYNISRRVKELSPEWLEPRLRKLAYRPEKSLRMAERDRQYLVEYYRDDVRKLEGLVERDLSAWMR